MRANSCVCIAGVFAALAVTTTAARAQSEAPSPALQQEIDQLRRDIDALRQQYEQRLADLEARVASLQATQAAIVPAAPTAAVPPGAEGAGGPSGSLPIYGAASGSKIFNPDMAVVGDVLATAGRNRVTPSPAFELH